MSVIPGLTSNFNEKLEAAKEGSIDDYHVIFQPFENALRSFVYRLTADQEESKDVVQDVFLKSFESIAKFRGDEKNIKTWLFSIAANHSKNLLAKRKRWESEAQDVCRDSLVNDPDEQQAFAKATMGREAIQYEIKEHIDFCFTCMGKALPVDQQVALILKDVYSFRIEDIAEIMDSSAGKIKHLLHDARTWMQRKYAGRCSLINKQGTCYQCDELSDIFKPLYKQGPEKEILKNAAKKESDQHLLELRAKLVSEIDPLQANGSDLHDSLMNHLKKVNGY